MIQDIGIGVAFFSAIVMTLVTIVLLARHWLAPQGEKTVTVNGTPVTMSLGRNLLRALADNGIHLPSPCGGRGICGQCKITIIDAPGPPLPTEAGRLTRRESRQGVRLACANKVRGEFSIKVPDEFLRAEQHICKVASVQNVSTFLREISLELPPGDHLEFEAGQYIMLEAPPYQLDFHGFAVDSPYRSTWDKTGLFDLTSKNLEKTQRAYSLANAPADKGSTVLVVRIALPPPGTPAGTPPGIVSSYIFGLRPGDQVEITGPYGDFRAQDDGREMVFIAGGAGIAPIRSIILDQLKRLGTTQRITFWYGARALQDICYSDEFDRLAQEHSNFTWQVALSAAEISDDWRGSTGFIHNVIYDQFLTSHEAPEELEYYLCGPPVMSSAVIQMLEDLGVDRSSIFFDDFGAGS
jgi:Na+-transporting NADH:ubiquinone oxidoreductase subunit F